MTLDLFQTFIAVALFCAVWFLGQLAADAYVRRQQRYAAMHAYVPHPAPSRRHASLREPFDQEQWSK